MGLDYLAMRVFVNRGTIAGVGRRIGVGKGVCVCSAIRHWGHHVSCMEGSDQHTFSLK